MSRDEPRSAVDRLADVVFYGPLGFALEHRRLLPQLAQRGRRQIAFTRTIGRFTVRHGREQVQGLIGGLTGAQSAEPPAARPPVANAGSSNGSAPDVGVDEVSADQSASLAIPQYDSLSAIQVVPRLEGLTGAELETLREYEAATRSRRTILAKISQLQQ